MPIIFVVLYFIIEAYVLFLVASKIGFLITLLLLVLAAFAGSALVRSQGLDIFKRATASMMQGQSPQVEIVEGTILLVCGIILIIPGFITDVLVLPLLIPALRHRVAIRMLARLAAQRADSAHCSQHKQYNNGSTDGFVETRSSSYTAYTSSSSPFVFYRFFTSSSDFRGVDDSSNTYQARIDDQQEIIDCTVELEEQPQKPNHNDSQNSNKDSGRDN